MTEQISIMEINQSNRMTDFHSDEHRSIMLHVAAVLGGYKGTWCNAVAIGGTDRYGSNRINYQGWGRRLTAEVGLAVIWIMALRTSRSYCNSFWHFKFKPCVDHGLTTFQIRAALLSHVLSLDHVLVMDFHFLRLVTKSGGPSQITGSLGPMKGHLHPVLLQGANNITLN